MSQMDRPCFSHSKTHVGKYNPRSVAKVMVISTKLTFFLRHPVDIWRRQLHKGFSFSNHHILLQACRPAEEQYSAHVPPTSQSTSPSWHTLNLPKVCSNRKAHAQVKKNFFLAGYMDWCTRESCFILSPTYPGETWNIKLHHEQGGQFNLSEVLCAHLIMFQELLKRINIWRRQLDKGGGEQCQTGRYASLAMFCNVVSWG